MKAHVLRQAVGGAPDWFPGANWRGPELGRIRFIQRLPHGSLLQASWAQIWRDMRLYGLAVVFRASKWNDAGSKTAISRPESYLRDHTNEVEAPSASPQPFILSHCSNPEIGAWIARTTDPTFRTFRTVPPFEIV
jgi:hypothetical protein